MANGESRRRPCENQGAGHHYQLIGCVKSGGGVVVVLDEYRAGCVCREESIPGRG